MRCRYCHSDKVICSQGDHLTAYECQEENCKHQWIERFEEPEDKEEANEPSQRRV